MKKSRLLGAVCACLVTFISTSTYASLILTIDNYTTDELSFSISGTFDTDTIGDQPGWLAIKNDWSNNFGVHTELFSSAPLETLNTITIGGVAPTTFIQDSVSTWDDNIFFQNPFGSGIPILAGTTVSGSITLTGIGIFNPADAATIELVSGFNDTVVDWVRLESSTQSAIPIPAAVWLFGSGLLGLVGIARKKAT